jgi:hypothetical protein
MTVVNSQSHLGDRADGAAIASPLPTICRSLDCASSGNLTCPPERTRACEWITASRRRPPDCCPSDERLTHARGVLNGIGREKIQICSTRHTRKRVRGAKWSYVRGTASTRRDPSSAAHPALLPIYRPRKHTSPATGAIGGLMLHNTGPQPCTKRCAARSFRSRSGNCAGYVIAFWTHTVAWSVH